jgi:hypothetical protein
LTVEEDTRGSELTCKATSEGGNNSKTVRIIRDDTPPLISITPDIRDGEVFAEGQVPPEPRCQALDDISDVLVRSCEVSGYETGIGNHTITFTATDTAGNEARKEISYQVVVGSS